MIKERVLYFDIARALCMLWVVGYWHPIGYWISPYNGYNLGDGGEIITWGILAAFTFFSGYFLRKKSVDNLYDFVSFYKARFFKFYILYLISCITLYIAGIILSQSGNGQVWFQSFSSFIYSIFGLGTYFGQAPATLWYMSMLMSFYYITPFILYFNKTNSLILVILLNIGLYIFTVNKGIDNNNISYFPFFCLGLLITDIDSFFKKHIVLKFFVLLLLIVMIYVFFTNDPLKMVPWFYVNSLIFIFILLLVSKFIENRFQYILPLFVKISFTSMAAYLFHRQVYGVLKLIFNRFEVKITPYLTILIFLPIVFIVSYYIQLLYNKLFNKFLK